MPFQYDAKALAFIQNNHRIVNAIYVDQILHNMGLRCAVSKARALATVDVDHTHQGSRYWLTSAVIDAALAFEGSAA